MLPVLTQNYITECNCDTKGARSSICDDSNGQCECLDRYTGLKCAMCADGYYNENQNCIGIKSTQLNLTIF